MTYSQRTIGSRHVYQRKFYVSLALQKIFSENKEYTAGCSHVSQTLQKVFSEDKAEYTTGCGHGGSSSWEIVVTLRKDSLFDNFRMSVNLKRIDAGMRRLKVALQIWLMDINGKTCPESYRLKCKLRGHETTRKRFILSSPSMCSYKCFLQEDRVTFPRNILVAKYTFKASGCHRRKNKKVMSESSSPDSKDEGMDRILLSKL
ncbi:hypothetical protein AVEN_254615-1 [Araneus ventricosus]|uniref:Uncharacterized protein n=1 Tax=Araneus ventricosus TaxID=182803 RepID=A0A4Y2T026_ARAVE|nr:hypothetical protein AVEN_161955-1 [Araneus ventricosus]GBN93566.1 hypothetical protein AVEN_254615-1 [Araneus ventricosus]